MAGWDVDKYKVDSESEEQWNLRRDFMERWKTEIPEERLVCLARVFINLEFFGCRYPSPVMQQVAELSKEVAFKYREKKKTKLQRTFVSASDAAEDRAKGGKRPYGKEHTPPTTSQSKKMMFVQARHEEDQCINPVTSQNQPRKDKRSPTNLPHFECETNTAKINKLRYNKNNPIIHTRFGNLVLHDNQAIAKYIGKLITSCDICKVSNEWIYSKEDDNIICKCVINNIEVATGSGENQKIAKENTATLAWKILQKECYSVIMLQSHFSKDKKISIQDVDQSKTSVQDALDVKVESAIASRMMQLMGWKGGALGVSANGISEPIAPHLKQIRRAGLGSSDSVSIQNAIRKTMLKFKKSESTDFDLVFANDFTKEERAAMHGIALNLGLKSKSYGKNDDRYLVISKFVTPAQLVQSLLDSGGSNEKYKLVKPTV